MTTPSPNKKLSTNLMGMKFMQRRQQADLVVKQEQEEASRREEAHWVVNRPGAAVIPPTAVVADEQVVTGVRSGRMSFGQFNPSIEELHAGGKKEVKVEEKDTLEWSAVYRSQEKAKTEVVGKKSVYGRNRKRSGDDDDDNKSKDKEDTKEAKRAKREGKDEIKPKKEKKDRERRH